MHMHLLLQVLLLGTISYVKGNYEPTWESLDARPLPLWYDEAKLGIFIHWGVFSVPSYKSEWFWFYWKEQRYQDVLDFVERNYPPKITYQDFASDFTAEFFDPEKWAQLFQASGARYVVLTTKHHEGFTLWPSATSFSWNAVDIGPKRDIVKELSTAIKKQESLRFGVYHSFFEWYNPLWVEDKINNFTTDRFVTEKTLPELYDLVNLYNPEIIWSDGEAEAPDDYWRSKEFLAWLYNSSPVKDNVVVNDRWGNGTSCNHGGFFNCADRYNPGVVQPHKWENAITIDRASWGYRRNTTIKDYLTIEEILSQLARTVSCGGNLLINVGPTKEGLISPIFEERLLQLGEWMSINGEAIYSTNPWDHQNDTINSDVWYVQKDSTVYGLLLEWPQSGTLELGSIEPKNDTSIELLSYNGTLTFSFDQELLKITLPNLSLVKSKWVYAFKFVNII